jgi:hypothetical protein
MERGQILHKLEVLRDEQHVGAGQGHAEHADQRRGEGAVLEQAQVDQWIVQRALSRDEHQSESQPESNGQQRHDGNA